MSWFGLFYLFFGQFGSMFSFIGIIQRSQNVNCYGKVVMSYFSKVKMSYWRWIGHAKEQDPNNELIRDQPLWNTKGGRRKTDHPARRCQTCHERSGEWVDLRLFTPGQRTGGICLSNATRSARQRNAAGRDLRLLTGEHFSGWLSSQLLSDLCCATGKPSWQLWTLAGRKWSRLDLHEKVQRILSNDLSFQYKRVIYQIQKDRLFNALQ